MSIKKTVAIAAAAGALAAVAMPAMAVENQFNGSYKFMGYQTNFFNGVAGNLAKDAGSGFMAEQRARLQYTAKANADLKLVTQFELDTRFGGKATSTGAITDVNAGYLGTATGNDGGNLDADQLTLETKNIYIDANCPITGANVKVGMQPWADSYQSLFLLADMTGAYATKKFGPATASLGWFRFNDDTAKATAKVGQLTSDLIVVDGKYALNKDMTVGASYYNIQDDAATTKFELMHMIGVNADLNVGQANIKPFAALQFGDIKETAKTTMKGMMLGATSKIKVGPGAVNLAGVYLSGDTDAKLEKSFKTVSANATYFNAANMWLLVRNGQAVNSSTSVLSNDLTVGGRGIVGLFGGYEGTMDKVFYNANIGYAQQAVKATGEKGVIGTEINAQVGYKMFDNMTASAAFAYAVLGDKYDAVKCDDPYALNLQLSYTF